MTPRMISGGYLRAIRAPRSREPGVTDNRPKVPLSAIMNQRFVDLFAPGQI